MIFHTFKNTVFVKKHPFEAVIDKLIVCGLENQIDNKFQYYGSKRIVEFNQ